jgi:hypothetical protein
MERSALIAELGEEERKIQVALRELGYFAHTVKFQYFNSKLAPTLEIEARAWQKGDDELIANP